MYPPGQEEWAEGWHWVPALGARAEVVSFLLISQRREGELWQGLLLLLPEAWAQKARGELGGRGGILSCQALRSPDVGPTQTFPDFRNVWTYLRLHLKRFICSVPVANQA